MAAVFNPNGYNLKELGFFDTRWSVDVSIQEVREYIDQYQKIPGKKIVASMMYWTNQDFIEDKFVVRFFIK